MPEGVWTRAAESDLQEIFSQTEDAREGSGQHFLSLVDAALELVRKAAAISAGLRPQRVRRASAVCASAEGRG